MSSLKSPNAPCLTCKHARNHRRRKDGSWTVRCAWIPTAPIAETWRLAGFTKTVEYDGRVGKMYLYDDGRFFRTCGAWERKDQDA